MSRITPKRAVRRSSPRVLTRLLAGLALSLLLVLGLPAASGVPVVGDALAPQPASARPAAYINCYSYALRGIFRGETGAWLHRICYNTVTCQWQVMSVMWVPDSWPLSVTPA